MLAVAPTVNGPLEYCIGEVIAVNASTAPVFELRLQSPAKVCAALAALDIATIAVASVIIVFCIILGDELIGVGVNEARAVPVMETACRVFACVFIVGCNFLFVSLLIS